MAGEFKAGAIVGKIRLDNQDWNLAITKMKGDQERMRTQSKRTGGAFGKMWKQVAMGVGITNLITRGVTSVVSQFKDMIRVGREFEKEWANVTTMITDTTVNTEEFKDELMKISPVLGSTTDMAKGMYQVLSASVEPAKAIEFLGEAAVSAEAGVTDIATSVDALTTVINAYGLEAEDVTGISDIMFQTVKRGKLTYEELATSIGTVAPVAATVGVKFEDVSAAVASLTRQGIDARTATMQLRQAMMSVLKPSEDARSTARKLGIDFSVAGMKAKGFGAFMLDIKKKTGGSNEALAKLFPNVRALAGIMALTGRAAQGFTKDLELMADATGSTEEAFQKQMQSADFWMKAVGNTVTNMKSAFFEGLVDPMKEGIKSSEDLKLAMEALVTSAQGWGKVIGTGLTPLLGKWLDKLKSTARWVKILEAYEKGRALAMEEDVNPTFENSIELYAKYIKEQQDLTEFTKEFNGLMIGPDGLPTNMENLHSKMTPIVSELKSMKTYIEPIPDDVVELRKEIATLTQKLDDGTLSWTDYLEKMKLAKGEITPFSVALKDLEMAEIEIEDQNLDTAEGWLEWVDIWKTINPELAREMGILTTKNEDVAKEVESTWDKATDGMMTAWSQMFGDWLASGDIFKGDFTKFVDGIVDIFTDMIGQLLAGWTETFIKGLISSSADAGAKITENIAGSLGGAGTDSVAGGFSSIASQAGELASGLTAISTVINTIANVASLFKKAGPSSTDSWNFEHTQRNTKEIRDWHFINHQARLNEIAKYVDNLNPKLFGIRKYLVNRQDGLLSSIANYTMKTAKYTRGILDKTGTAQHGAIHMNPGFFAVGEDAPRIPEITAPIPDLLDIFRNKGGGGNPVYIVIGNEVQELDMKEGVKEIMIESVPELTRQGRLKINSNAIVEER